MIARWLYATALLFCIAAARVLSFGGGKLHRLVVSRKKLSVRIAAFRSVVPGKLCWFHVASAGELEQAIPLMEALRAFDPERVVYLSFFSPSAETAAKAEAARRNAQGVAAPWDYADYLCWDLPWSARRYIERLEPECFISMHAEMWPVLFHELAARQIPIAMGAMYLPGAGRYSGLKNYYFKKALQSVARIATVDVRTAHWLQQLLPTKNIQTLGDPRIDRVRERADRNPLGRVARPEDSPEVVLASLHRQDLAAIQPWLCGIGAKSNVARVWIVPHEPKESALIEFESKISKWGLKMVRASVQKDASLVLVDSVGQLAELYARASIAFIGGSFDKSVHNVLEPAAYAVAIVTGPKIENSCEATEMAAAGALVQTDSPSVLADTLDSLLDNELYRAQLGKRAQAFLSDRRGVGERYGVWLREWLPL